jgi:hypothetical protein
LGEERPTVVLGDAMEGGRKELLLRRAGRQSSAISSLVGFCEVVGRWRRAQAVGKVTGR